MAKGDQTRLLKPTTEYRGNFGTTCVIDDDMQTTLLPNEYYLIEGYLQHSGNTASEPLRVTFQAPSSAEGWYSIYQTGVDGSDFGFGFPYALTEIGTTLTTVTLLSATSFAFFSHINGYVKTGGSPSLGGTFGLSWAQRGRQGSPAGAGSPALDDPSFLTEGSWIVLTEVGSPIGGQHVA